MEQHIKRGDFTPEEYEIAFGEENHLDSMTFALEDGEKMIFSGVVDRMDSVEDEENKTSQPDRLSYHFSSHTIPS